MLDDLAQYNHDRWEELARAGIAFSRPALDLDETHLENDRLAAEHYGTRVRAVQGDMRDLSCFADNLFDIIWHAHSINFVPDARQVFGEVARALRPGACGA